MNIYIKGSTKDRRDIAYSTVVWSLKELGLDRIKNLDIEVKLKKLPKNEFGQCEVQDSIREFVIDVKKDLSLKSFVSTILHEMVHVKQFVRKELSPSGLKWKSKSVPEDTEYLELPWEKEAHKMEEILVKKIWKEDIL